MRSNFTFLEKDFPVLANFGQMAEKYCLSDPNSCLMKLGMLGETIVNLMFTYDRIPLPEENNAVRRIDILYREGLLTQDLTDILHGLRKVRNKAVHENYASESDAKAFLADGLQPLRVVHADLWRLELSAPGLCHARIFGIHAPTDPAAEEKRELLLTEQAETAASQAQTISKESRRQRASQMASQRLRSEAETRFLIDQQLRQVGWEADTQNLRYSQGTRPANGRNIAIAEWPTNSTVGNRGRVDYALFIGLQMVGIIEAKAEHKDIPSVIDYQGKDYPRNIRDEDAPYQIGTWGYYKVPFTFATNGRPYLEQYKTKSGIWFLDLRQPSNVPKALHGWMSPDNLRELLAKNPAAGNQALEQMPFDLLRDKDGLNLRDYQLRAIQATEQAIIGGKNTALLAMATGTGKIRTVLGMIYRLPQNRAVQAGSVPG